MDSNPDRAPLWLVAIATLLGAWLTWIGHGLEPQWWAAWLAPLPLLAIAARMKWPTAALAAFIAFAGGGLSWWSYLHDGVGVPLAVCVIAIATPALGYLLVVLLFRALALRGRFLAAALSVPTLSTTLAWLSALQSPHGTFGNVAYTQMDALPVIQIAAVTGLWGVGFLVWCASGAIAAATLPGLAPRQRASVLVLGTGVITLGLGYGAWRLNDSAGDAQSVRVGLVSIGGMEDSEADAGDADRQRTLAAYVNEMEQLARDGATVVVAPESALLLHAHAVPALADLSTRHGVRLLIGAEDHSALPTKRNAALVFEPGGHPPASYFKHRLIPGFEDRYAPGDTRTVLSGEPPIGVAICKDLDFTETARAYGQRGTRLLLVPAWDFDADAWMHARMAVLRGVEGGFAVARTARDGLLTLSDDRGRVVAQASSVGNRGPTRLLADITPGQSGTPYARYGDLLPWSCLTIVLALLALLAFRRKP